MNINGTYVGYWNRDFILDETIWSTGLFNLLNPEQNSSNFHYSIESLNLIAATINGMLQSGGRKNLAVNLLNSSTGQSFHILDFQPHYSSEGKLICIKVDVYRMPEWEELQKDPLCHINIFSSIFNSKAGAQIVFNAAAEMVLVEEFKSPESLMSDLDLHSPECKNAFERTIRDKRLVIAEMKGLQDSSKTYLLVYEPVLNQHNEIQFVFLFTYRMAQVNRANAFLLNQFLAIESAMDGIALLNEKGEYYYLNDTHVKMFGYETEQELVGKTWKAIYGPREIERIETNLFPLLMQQGKWSGETLGISKQGKPVYQEISLNVLPNGGMVCVCRDISHRKSLEKLQDQSDRLLRNIKSLIVITNAEKEIEWVNQAFCNVTGYSMEEVLGKKPGYFLQGPETDLTTKEYMKEHIRLEKPFNCEIINYSKSGRKYWIEIKCQPIFGTDGKLEKFFAIQEDITQRKHTEIELRENRQRLEMALEASGNAVWEIDLNTKKIQTLNFWKMLGYEDMPIEMDLKEYLNLVHEDDRDFAANVFAQYPISTSVLFEYQQRLLHKNGESIWVIQRSRISERDAQGKPTKVTGTTMNITPLKSIEEQLVVSEEKWKKAVEGSGAGIAELDLEKGKFWYSQKALQLLGYNEIGELSENQSDFLELIHPDDKPTVISKITQCLEGHITLFEHEYRILCRDQRYHWFDIHGVVSRRASNGKALAFIGSAYDITDRKHFEDKLKLSEERWKFAIDGANAGIWDWDLGSNQAYYSDKAKQLHGMKDPGNLFPADIFFSEQVYPDDRANLYKKSQEMILGQLNQLELVYRIIHPELGVRWINDRAMVIRRNQDDQATRIIGIFFDITEKKEMEEKILESEQRWIFALEGSSSGVWDVNLETRDVFYSPKLKELLGFKAEDPFEHNSNLWKNLIHPEDVEHTSREFKEFLIGRLPTFENEFRVLHQDGSYHWFLYKGIIANRNENGKASRLIGTMADITLRKINELELIKAKELAEASAKAKRTFLANMSHEIRTPMNAILGLSEQLSLTSLKDDQQFLVNIINDAAKSLKILIDDILDFSKIEEGKLQLENIDFDIHEQLKRTNSMLLHKAQEKNISIRLDFDWKIAPLVKGDPTRLSQILLNVVGNAIKFTQVGYVKVVCKLLEKSRGKQVVLITISDTGVGMSEESMKNLFKDFYQEDQSIARKYGGTGLGLSISRNLVSLMQGDIRIKSKKDFGTDVFITLPFELSEKSELVSDDESTLINKSLFKGKRILMVEDNKVNRIVANIVLKKMEVQVDEAENGRAALYMLEENNYDLILMDLQMPEMDGITATSIIRANGIRTPIVALTANAVQEELEELLSKGFNSYVVKPFEEKKLLMKMQEYLLNGNCDQPNNRFQYPNLIKKETLKDLLQKNSDCNSETEKLLANAMKFELSSAIEGLKKAIPALDWNNIKKIAHKQKSMLLSLGIRDESESIIPLSTLNLEQVDTLESTARAKSLLKFFESIYKKAIEFYPDTLDVASAPPASYHLGHIQQ